MTKVGLFLEALKGLRWVWKERNWRNTKWIKYWQKQKSRNLPFVTSQTTSKISSISGKKMISFVLRGTSAYRKRNFDRQSRNASTHLVLDACTMKDDLVVSIQSTRFISSQNKVDKNTENTTTLRSRELETRSNQFRELLHLNAKRGIRRSGSQTSSLGSRWHIIVGIRRFSCFIIKWQLSELLGLFEDWQSVSKLKTASTVEIISKTDQIFRRALNFMKGNSQRLVALTNVMHKGIRKPLLTGNINCVWKRNHPIVDDLKELSGMTHSSERWKNEKLAHSGAYVFRISIKRTHRHVAGKCIPIIWRTRRSEFLISK